MRPNAVDDVLPIPRCEASADQSEAGWGYAAEVVGAHVDALYPERLEEAQARELLALPADCALPPGVVEQLHQVLIEPVRHLIAAGGGRWRPYLMAAAIDAMGGDNCGYGPLLAAVEVVHTGSLMVDDVQDGAVVRRGVPAAHVRFDPALALNAGTAAYFAFDRALRLVPQKEPSVRAAMQQSFFGMLRAAHAGQGLDIAGQRAAMDEAVASGDAERVLGAVRFTHRLKSGAAVRCLMELGAYACGATAGQREAAARYGEAVGTAYQITDDVQDLTGVIKRGVPTKAVGEDLRNGKVTMPLAHAVALMPRAELTDLWERVKEGGACAEAAARAVEALTSCGALDACRQEAETLVEDAWAGLEPLLSPSPAVAHLRAMGRDTAYRSRIA
ncbi:polyprenyl synthetase family protein [Streptomyces sp. NPDC127061]|uniref:polyprenyl synthetase family protein n=1 Tax=Streptomyces sp. NPDC127061 TaxID=3347122 RepID=UPI00364AD4E3